MNSTPTLLQKRTLQPAKYYFKEIVPLCSKNGLENKRPNTSSKVSFKKFFIVNNRLVWPILITKTKFLKAIEI